MQEIIVDARTESPLVTTSTLSGDKTMDGEPITIERVFPLPTVQDGMSPTEFGEVVFEWLDKLRTFQAGKGCLTIVDDDGDIVWKEVAPDTENGLLDPFVRKPITLTSVVEYIRKAMSVDHNRVMRELAVEKAGIAQESGPKKKGLSKKLPSRRVD